MPLIEHVGIWVAALLTLCIYSFLYKDNPFYKVAEHLFVGISAGYLIVRNGFFEGFVPYAWEPLKKAWGGQYAEFTVIIPLLIGLLFFTRFIPRYSWLIRYPIVFLLGIGMGIAIPLTMQEIIFRQMHGTLRPFGALSQIGPLEIFVAILMLIGVICTLTYFFFSVEHRGAVGLISKIGIIFLMIGFGSAFGNTVMGRVSLLIERVDFLVYDWFTPYWLPILLIFGVLIVVSVLLISLFKRS